MKNHKKLTTRSFLCLGAALFLLIASRVDLNAGSTGVDLVDLRKKLGNVQAKISDTTGALESLKQAAKDGKSLKPGYEAFTSKLSQLQSDIDDVRSEATKMRARADVYYKGWQEELTKMGNPKLREKALNRYADAKEEFDEIIVTAEEAKRELGPYMADLNDVATYLKSDLSADALKTLSNTIWKLGVKSRAVVASIQHVNTQIGKALEELPESK